MSVSAQLSPVQFHVLPDGKRMRYALFEPPQTPRGTMIVAPGRREFVEKKYAEMGKEFLQRGYRLIVFEWRGHGLSSRFFDGSKRQRDHILDFNLYLDDLDSFYKNVVLKNQTGNVFVMGHSIGGHLMLRWLAERQKIGIDGAMFTAPMLALGPRAAHSVSNSIVSLMLHMGKSESYVPGQHDYDEHDRQFKGNPLTQDPQRYGIIERYFEAHPEMKIGGVTWGWLSAALKSMRLAREDVYMHQVKIPVLAMTGSHDTVTPALELARYLSNLPDIRNVILPGGLHDVMNEIEIIRDEAWRHIDGFLAEVTKV